MLEDRDEYDYGISLRLSDSVMARYLKCFQATDGTEKAPIFRIAFIPFNMCCQVE
jgi:hypothetical protein